MQVVSLKVQELPCRIAIPGRQSRAETVRFVTPRSLQRPRYEEGPVTTALRADARITSHLDDWRMWRTHSCVPRRHSCRRPLLQGAEASSETRRGTQECVRHGSRLRSYFCVVP